MNNKEQIYISVDGRESGKKWIDCTDNANAACDIGEMLEFFLEKLTAEQKKEVDRYARLINGKQGEQKYNPNSQQLNKGKRSAWQGYEKGQMIHNDHQAFLIDIMTNGGQVEIRQEGMMQNGASYCEVIVYYVHPQSQIDNQKINQDE